MNQYAQVEGLIGRMTAALDAAVAGDTQAWSTLANAEDFRRELAAASKIMRLRPMPDVGNVFCDIARTIGAHGLVIEGDSRSDSEVFYGWAQEFEADFLARAGRGGVPGDTYVEDVEDFALAKARAHGYVSLQSKGSVSLRES